MKVYGDALSGNCYKVQLLLALLGVEHTWVPVNILRGDTRKADFLALNANGKIPLLELEDGRTLPESNAILNYLAHGTRYLPDDAWQRAEILAWQFFEQYSHEPFIAVARFINRYLGLPEDRMAEYHAKQEGGHKALGVMELGLAGRDWLVGDHMTIADISLYAYTHVADEGGFDLTPYPGIQAWLDRVAAQPGFVPMQRA